MWKMLYIEDDPKWFKLVQSWFKNSDFQVLNAGTGEEGLQLAKREQPDVIVVDLELLHSPMQGEDVIVELRRADETTKIPIVLYSRWIFDRSRRLALARERIEAEVPKDKRINIEYSPQTKGDLQELEIKVKRVILESQSQKQRPSPTIRIGSNELKLGEGYREVWVNGNHRKLSPLSARILELLDRQRGKPLSVEKLKEAWTHEPSEETIRMAIQRLRTCVELDLRNPVFVANDPGFGYKLEQGD